MSLLIFLLMGLSTSSFFLSSYLSKTINSNKHSETQLNFALAHNNLTALRFAWKNSTFHSEAWLSFSKKLAKTEGEVAYLLADYYHEQPKLAIFWYKNAIRLNYVKASITLAEYYYQQGQLTKAKGILAAMPVKLTENLNVAANMVKINIAIDQGSIPVIKHITASGQLQKTPAGQLLLADIKKYQLLPSIEPLIDTKPLTASCSNSIQLFATNLKHLKQLEHLILAFQQQVLSKTVCFMPVRYLPINALDCSFELDQAIRCDELSWQQWANSINARYLGVMLPKGGANVHFGIMYFDAQDSVDVFAHEISHLLGFIDEYPLAADHVKCQASQKTPFSHNISILKKNYQGEKKRIRNKVLQQITWAKYIKNTTPILHLVKTLNGKEYWQVGTPQAYENEVGLFAAQTCDLSDNTAQKSFNAFKPVSKRTKLQYFALDFPQLYLSLLQDNAKQYLMPSFHYNIALAYFQQASLQQKNVQQRAIQKKNIEQANYWLKQAASWEQEVNRREKVRQGKFD